MNRQAIASALALAALLVLTAGSAQAAPGDLDPSFGSGGKVTTAIGSGNDAANGIAIQSDHKIVAAGASSGDFAVTRYKVDGSLDSSFGSGGKVTTDFAGGNDNAYAIVIQSDGKIVVAGSSYNGTDDDFALARYNSDGSLDTTFDTDGKVTTPIGSGDEAAKAVALQSDGKIVAAGYSSNGTDDDFALVRYSGTNGSLDSSFDTDGKVTTAIGTGEDVADAVIVRPDGRTVAVGYTDSGGSNFDFALVRYTVDGSLDSNFGSNGKVTTPIGSGGDVAKAAVLQGDLKIVAAGVTSGTSDDFALARYNADGSLDTTFDTDGKVTTAIASGNDLANGVAVRSDGKIVAAGEAITTNDDFALARYNSDGSLDPSFGSGGKVTTAIGSNNDAAQAVGLQADGRIVAAGYSNNGSNNDFALARYFAYAADGSGTLDVSPASVSAGSSTTLSFTYTAATGGMGAGEVRVNVPSGWTGGSVSTDKGTASLSGGTIVVSSLTLSGGESAHITYSGATAPTTVGASTFSAQEKSDASGTLMDLSSTPTVTVAPAAADHLTLAGATTDLAAGSSRMLTADVEDAFGNMVDSSDSVIFTQTGGTGSVGGLGSVSASGGVAGATVTGVKAGPVTIQAASSGIAAAAISFTVVPGAADHLTLASETTDLAAGSSRTLTAELEDAFGNTTYSGATVTFAKVGGSGTVTGLGSSDASAGVASRQVAGDKVGPITIRASAGGVTGAEIAFKVVPGAANKLVYTFWQRKLKLGKSMLVGVEIRDAHANRVQLPRLVTFKASGKGRVAGLGKVRSEGGVAWDVLTAAKKGSVKVKASTPGLPSVSKKLKIVK